MIRRLLFVILATGFLHVPSVTAATCDSLMALPLQNARVTCSTDRGRRDIHAAGRTRARRRRRGTGGRSGGGRRRRAWRWTRRK